MRRHMIAGMALWSLALLTGCPADAPLEGRPPAKPKLKKRTKRSRTEARPAARPKRPRARPRPATARRVPRRPATQYASKVLGGEAIRSRPTRRPDAVVHQTRSLKRGQQLPLGRRMRVALVAFRHLRDARGERRRAAR